MDGRSLCRIVKRQATSKTAIVTDRTISGSAHSTKPVAFNVRNHRLGACSVRVQEGLGDRLKGVAGRHRSADRRGCLVVKIRIDVSAQMLIPPIEHRLEALPTVPRLAGSRQLVVLTGEDQQLGVHTGPLQCGLVLLRLFKRAAEVEFRMHHQAGRAHLRGLR